MADPRFFSAAGPHLLGRLAELAGATLAPGGDAAAVFDDVASLDAAGPTHVSFIDNRRYVDNFMRSRAGACIAPPNLAEKAPHGMALLLSESPYRAYALVARAFYPKPVREPGIHAAAIVDPGAVLGEGVVIGDDTTVGVGASLSHCLIGSRVLVHAGARIGQRGFGFAMDPESYVDVPQLGRVILHDDAEIGANSTIDRGSGPDTVIGPGCKIDNLVQIGHNVQLGRGCVIVAQAGISGSTKLEDHVVIAAQGGLTGHLSIGKGAQIAAQSGVMRDVMAGTAVCGSPAVPIKEFFRQTATLARLSKSKGRV